MFKIPFSKTIINYFRIKKLEKQLIKDNWVFSKERLNMIFKELEEWNKHYLLIDVKGKVVLDVGAGEGETALFYLMNGAKKVICIESNTSYFKNLKLNSNWHNIDLVLVPFELYIIKNLIYDFMKCDIEGYEEILLNVELNKPSVIEVHGLQLRDKFESQCFRIEKRKNNDCSTSYAYWGC